MVTYNKFLMLMKYIIAAEMMIQAAHNQYVSFLEERIFDADLYFAESGSGN